MHEGKSHVSVSRFNKISHEKVGTWSKLAAKIGLSVFGSRNQAKDIRGCSTVVLICITCPAITVATVGLSVIVCGSRSHFMASAAHRLLLF